MELTTDRLLLREIALNDIPAIHNLHSLSETDQYNTMGIPESIEVTQQLVTDWLLTTDQLPRVKYVFVIENNKKEFIGIIGMNIGRPKYRYAEVWFKLHPLFWNNGYATEVVKCLLQFGFAQLTLHRIEAGCAVENLASAKVLEKCGFIKEGRCRKKLPIRGEWKDNFEFALLDEDYFKSATN